VKKISMLIAVVSVFGAMAQSALAQNLVAFNGGIGDITTGSTDTLLDTLRETLHLTWTKEGCDHGQCGPCTVHVRPSDQ
jgi:xanthine dehydrogenase iron-sulfur cluster and FAD-binding subunit A